MLQKFGNSFMYEFFYNDHLRRILEAEHKANDTWFFYPLSTVLGMFPWTIFVGAAFFVFLKAFREKRSQALYLFLLCWIFVVFSVFQFAHSKLTSYILPLFPAVAIITGDFICGIMNSEKSKFFSFLLLSWAALLLIPAGLFISTIKYPQYLPAKILVYSFILFYIILLGIMLILIRKREKIVNLYLLAFQVPLVLSIALFIHKSFDGYISSKGACEFLVKNYPVKGIIICSKTNIRGVRFFTDRDVAVVNVRGSNFFSPHPIFYFDSDENTIAFLKTQPITYGILAKSAFADIIRIADANKFKLDILKTMGNAYIIKVQSG